MRQIDLAHAADYGGWRSSARELLREGVAPESVIWNAGGPSQDLFSHADDVSTKWQGEQASAKSPVRVRLRVPPDFLNLAEYAVCHSDEDRFAVLYRVLWRVSQGETGLFERRTDDDIHRLHELRKSVARDRHKMTAFVRFRQVPGCSDEQYSAWFEPDHHILRLTSQFFRKRFTNMRWSIFTPEGSAHWNGEALAFGPPGTRESVPEGEAMEALWKTYFASIFNPARLRLDAMRAEMPVKYWKNLPEAPLIARLTTEAGARTGRMVESAPSEAPRFAHKAVSAEARVPTANTMPRMPSASLEALCDQIRQCESCPGACQATQAVTGQGAANARIMLVGEQPGDQEDLRGQAFVGPAGLLLRQVLTELDVDEHTLYLTNSVKHFHYSVRGKRRLHQRPDRITVETCRPWLFEEIGLVKPSIIVALGATAGFALLRRQVMVERERGVLEPFAKGMQWMLTSHPAHVLRTRDARQSARLRARLKADLAMACDALTV